MGVDGVAVEDAFDLEGKFRCVWDPSACVALVYFEEESDGVVGVVAESFWYVRLDLRGWKQLPD